MRKRIRLSEFERYEHLVNVIGKDVVKSFIPVKPDVLKRAFEEDPDFNTLKNYCWDGVSPFDVKRSRSATGLAQAGGAFRYLLKIRSAEFCISTSDVVGILKHVAAFYVVGALPEWID